VGLLGDLPWLRFRSVQATAALMFGCAMPFAFSPYDHLWLAIVSLAGWLWLIRLGRPLLTGFAFGIGWFGLGGWWLGWTLHTHADYSWVAATFSVVLLGCELALFAMLWAWLSWKAAGKSGWIVLSFPLAGIMAEWLRGHMLLGGLPWTALGNLMLDTPAIGWGAWFGVYGMALLPALAAASLTAVVSGRLHACMLGAVSLVLLVLCSPEIPVTQGVVRQAALIQGSIPQNMKWRVDYHEASMESYIELSSGVAASADVIVWPEGAIPFFLERGPESSARLNSQFAKWNTPVLYGSLKWEGLENSRNGLFVWDAERPESEPVDRPFVGKHHLVPFGEYVPSWLPFVRKIVHGDSDYLPDDGSGVLQSGDSAFGALICFESLFPEEARNRVLNGAQVLVNVSNDAWFGTTPAVWQSFQSARMRAVETGRYLLRAANSGITAVIRPDGTVEQSIPVWIKRALLASYRLSNLQTPYVRWGDWPLLLCPLFLVLIWLIQMKENRYQRP